MGCQFLEQRVKVISLMGRNAEKRIFEKFKFYLDTKDILLEEVKVYTRANVTALQGNLRKRL